MAVIQRMSKRLLWGLALCVALLGSLGAQTGDLGTRLKGFDQAERKAMKISSVELARLLAQGRVQLIDVRFVEEFAAWNMPLALNIPLNQLPERLDELDRSKLLVTACPHKDRAIMARTYLWSLGYEVRYLEDGLIGLAEHWRGDRVPPLPQ